MSNSHLPNPGANERAAGPRPQPTVSSIFQVKERIHHTLSASNLALTGPLSWILTLQIFAISATWWIATLPIRIGIDVYDRHIRTIFPRLPSIRELLLSVRMAVLAIFPSAKSGPGVSSASGQPQLRTRRGRDAPAAQLPTLDVDLNSLPDGS